jgi:carbon-monoxide dehydrogenase large subunit
MTQFGIAQSVRRVEDPRLLKGLGSYTDDITPAGTAYGVVLRSPHAAAKIRSIDTSAVTGVLAIITAADLAADDIGTLPCFVSLTNRDGSKQYSPPYPALAGEAVRHVGTPVAFVVAETVQAARDGAEAIFVDYDILPSVTDLATAMDDDVPLVWDAAPHNICFDWQAGQKEKTEALFAAAAHVSRLTVVNNRIVASPMEARAALAEYDAATQRWTLRTNTQGGWLIKDMLGKAVFKTGADRFRIITPDVGGGFGMKLFLYAEHVLTCYAARRLARPVKWTSDRGEAFLSDTHGRDNITLGELALDADGTFLALRTRNVANMGSALSNFAPFIPTMAGTGVLPSVYGFQAVYAHVTGVFTNTVPVDAYRGAGRPEANYLVERLIDHAASELAIDRVELRRRNMVGPEAMPHTTPMGKTYDSGEFRLVLDAALTTAGWAGFEARRADSAARGKRRGIGLAYYLEATASSMSMSAPSPPARGTKPPMCSSPWTGSACRASACASARATPTPSPKAAAPAGRAACIPRARRSSPPPPPSSKTAAAPPPRRWRRRWRISSSRPDGSPSPAPTASLAFSIWPRPSAPGPPAARTRPRWMPPKWPRSSPTPSPTAATSPRWRSTRKPATWRCCAMWSPTMSAAR